MNEPLEHRRDPSWRCLVLDPFTNRDYRDGIGTFRECPACAEVIARVHANIAKHGIPVGTDSPFLLALGATPLDDALDGEG